MRKLWTFKLHFTNEMSRSIVEIKIQLWLKLSGLFPNTLHSGNQLRVDQVIFNADVKVSKELEFSRNRTHKEQAKQKKLLQTLHAPRLQFSVVLFSLCRMQMSSNPSLQSTKTTLQPSTFPWGYS